MEKRNLFMICIIVLITLTGCTANYNINIIDNTVHEDMEFYETDSKKINAVYSPNSTNSESGEKYTYKQIINLEKSYVNYAFKDNQNKSEVYSKNKIDETNKLGIKYSYDFNINDYTNSNIANSFAQYFSARTVDELYIISGLDFSNTFNRYSYLSNIKVNIKTNHKVAKSNADSSSNGSYVWNISKSNAKSKKVSIEIYKDVDYSDEEENDLKKDDKKSKISLTTILIVVLSIAISSFIVIIILRKKMDRNNKI